MRKIKQDAFKLVVPTLKLAEEFRERAAEWRAAGEDKFKDAFGDFASYVSRYRITL